MELLVELVLTVVLRTLLPPNKFTYFHVNCCMELRRATLWWHPLAGKLIRNSLVKQTVEKVLLHERLPRSQFFLFVICIQSIYLTIHATAEFISQSQVSIYHTS